MQIGKLIEELYERDKKLALNVSLAFHSSKWKRLPPPYNLDPEHWNAHLVSVRCEEEDAPCAVVLVRLPLDGLHDGGLNMLMRTWTRPNSASWRIFRITSRAKARRRFTPNRPLKWPFLFYDCHCHTLVRYYSRSAPGTVPYTEKAALELP